MNERAGLQREIKIYKERRDKERERGRKREKERKRERDNVLASDCHQY